MRYFGSFSLFLFLAVLIHSCSSDESNTPNDPNIENNRPLGTSAADILGPNEYGLLTVVLVYTNSFRPEPSSILGFKKEKLLSSKMYRHISSDNIIVTDHPWVNSNNSSKDELKMPILIFKWLKKIFLTKTKKLIKKNFLSLYS